MYPGGAEVAARGGGGLDEIVVIGDERPLALIGEDRVREEDEAIRVSHAGSRVQGNGDVVQGHPARKRVLADAGAVVRAHRAVGERQVDRGRCVENASADIRADGALRDTQAALVQDAAAVRVAREVHSVGADRRTGQLQRSEIRDPAAGEKSRVVRDYAVGQRRVQAIVDTAPVTAGAV